MLEKKRSTSWAPQGDVLMMPRTHTTLASFIEDILHNYHTKNHELQHILLDDFQSFLTKKVKADRAENNGYKTVNELFKAISQQPQKDGLVLLNTLIGLDVGDESVKIKGILNAVIGFSPGSDPEVYDLLESLLVYLTRLHKTSPQIVLYPIRDKIWTLTSFNLDGDRNTIISLFLLLNLLLRRFKFCLDALSPHITKLILFYIRSNDIEVRKLVVKTFKTALSGNDGCFQMDTVAIQQRLNSQFASVNNTDCRGAVKAAEIMVKRYPELLSKFKFESVPLDLLASTNHDLVLSGLAVIPFVLRANPHLFTPDIYCQYFVKMSPLIVAGQPMRNDALLSLGKFMFTDTYSYTLEGPALERLIKEVGSSVNSGETVYALLAVFRTNDEILMQKLPSIFELPLSSLMINAFARITKQNPTFRRIICRNVVAMTNKILLRPSRSSNDVILAFKTLKKLEVDTEWISPVLVLRYCIHQYDQDLAVRRTATHFVLDYQQKNPTPEITQQLIAFVSTEKDEELRLMVIPQLRKDGTEVYLAPALMPLLRDLNAQIRIESLQLLMSMIQNTQIRDFVSTFFAEKIRALQQCTNISQEHIECFLVGSRYALGADSDCRVEAYGMIFPVASFLVRRLLSERPPLFSAAIELLSYIIKIVPADEIEMPQLVEHLRSGLAIHSSKKRITASLMLFMSAMRVTSLCSTIYEEHIGLVKEVLELGNLRSTDIPYDMLLEALSTIGSVKPSLVKVGRTETNDSDVKMINSTSVFIHESGSDDNLVALMYASIGVVLSSILDIMENETLVALHSDALDTLMKVLNAYREISEKLEQGLIDRLHILFQSGSTSTISVILYSVAVVVNVLGDKFEPLVRDVVTLTYQKWDKIDKLLLLKAAKVLLQLLPDAISPHLLKLATVFTSSMETYSRAVVHDIFTALELMESGVKKVAHIVYPPLLAWIESKARETNVCHDRLLQLRNIFCFGGTVKFHTQIIRSMLSVSVANPNLVPDALSILVVVAVQVGKPILLYVPQIRQNLKLDENCELAKCFRALERDIPIPTTIAKSTVVQDSPRIQWKDRRQNMRIQTAQVGNAIGLIIPKEAFDESQWISWCEEFCNNSLRLAPSRALSLSTNLANRHPLFKDTIIPIAIALIYLDERMEAKEKMNVILQVVFSSPSVPKVVTRTFLSVVEILEYLGVEHPIKDATVSETARRAELLPQALRAAESLFTNLDDNLVKMLVVINKELGLPMAAAGVLKVAQQRGLATQSVDMNEQLCQWKVALDYYNAGLAQNPSDRRCKLGQLRCLMELSRYSELEKESSDFPYFQAAARWHLLDFKGFREAVSRLDPSDSNGMIFRVIDKALSPEPDEAKSLIYQMRMSSADILFPTIAQEYSRVYSEFDRIALLKEIEEVIAYKALQQDYLSADAFQVNRIKKWGGQIVTSWKLRFKRLPDDPRVLFEHLCVQSLVLSANDLRQEWKRFFSVSFEHKAVDLFESGLKLVKAFQPKDISILSAKLEWMKGNREKAITDLTSLARSLPKDDPMMPDLNLKLGKWLFQMQKPREAMDHIKYATQTIRNSTETWKYWSKIVLTMADQSQNPSFIVDAFNAALNGLLLAAKGNSLPFAILLLSVLRRQSSPELVKMFGDRMAAIPTHVWIDVLPEIVGRMNDQDPQLLRVIQDLFMLISDQHSHVIFYALMVPLKGDDPSRKKHASTVFELLRSKYPEISESYESFVNECMRISSTWWDICQTRLDEASRAYAVRHNITEMITLIQPLSTILSSQPATFLEVSFMRQFGQDLVTAIQHIVVYQTTHEIAELSSAWKIFTSVFQKQKVIMTENTDLPLCYMSPILAEMRDSQVCMPGMYTPNCEIVRINRVSENIRVSDSGRRPRNVGLIGTDGKLYSYLFKTSEYTKLEERIMQLFSFVNALMDKSDLPLKDMLSLGTYKVIPLSPHISLISELKNCASISNIVTQMRKLAKNDVSVEEKFVMTATNNAYNQLPLEQKLPIFEKALESCEGNEIQKTLLNYSADSAHWLQRRTMFTSSLAASSIVGYVIGLGDRHPRNIMLNSSTAKLVHIDFSHCFDVNLSRNKWPEKVPFRLTRMFLNALEVSRIEGTFRTCCENVMKLFRHNGSELMEVLEVFMYDYLSAANQGTPETVFEKVRGKLSGSMAEGSKVKVSNQVNQLIADATSHANLADMFTGWMPWW